MDMRSDKQITDVPPTISVPSGLVVGTYPKRVEHRGVDAKGYPASDDFAGGQTKGFTFSLRPYRRRQAGGVGVSPTLPLLGGVRSDGRTSDGIGCNQ